MHSPHQVWQDSKSKIHHTEVDAIAAERRYEIEALLERAFAEQSLAMVEYWNVQTLTPVADYFNRLMDQAQLRAASQGQI